MTAEPGILVTTAGALLATIAYGVVGDHFQARPATPQSRLANHAFSIWWYALAVATATVVMRNALGFLGVTILSIHLALAQAWILAHSIGFVALLTHLLYLLTSRETVARPIAALGVIHYLFFSWLLFFSEPTAVVTGTNGATFQLSGPRAEPLMMTSILLFHSPAVLAALAYGHLAMRLPEAALRYRVGLVAASILVWSLASAGAARSSIAQDPGLELVGTLLGLLAPLGVLFAYFPPAFVARHLVPTAADAA